MPRDGSGNYTRSDGTRTGERVFQEQDAADLGPPLAPLFDAHANDMATAIENSLAKDGKTNPTANLPMNGLKHTGVAPAAVRTEYATYGQLLDVSGQFIADSAVDGTANSITLTPSPAITAYVAGLTYRFVVEAENTGAVTVAVSGLAAASVTLNGSPLDAGDISVGDMVTITYTGSRFEITRAGPVFNRLTLAAFNALAARAAGEFYVVRDN